MSDRFYESPDWRFVVTDLNLGTLTILDHLARDRHVHYTLGAPAVAEGWVPSESPEVNIAHTDGRPFLSEGDRFLFGFRREAPMSADPWVIRFAGMVLYVGDSASDDNANANTRFAAYDPWQYAYRRPVRDGAGLSPGEDGYTITATGDQILLTLLENSETYDGPLYIKLDGPNIETTETLTFTVQQGMSLGEAMAALMATGNLDIVLRPIYDLNPSAVNIVELEVAHEAGIDRHSAIFAWDAPSRSITAVDSETEGTERTNAVQFNYGQGGPPVALEEDAASQTRYGLYWQQQFFPGASRQAVESEAVHFLIERAYGVRTVSFTPAADRMPYLFTEFDLGDRVPIYATSRLREPLNALQRIYSIPISISDDGVESVDRLVVGADGWTET